MVLVGKLIGRTLEIVFCFIGLNELESTFINFLHVGIHQKEEITFKYFSHRYHNTTFSYIKLLFVQ